MTHSHTQKSVPASMIWSGYAVFIWSIGYMIPHLYWALGGQAGGGLLKPEVVQSVHFETINAVATVFLTVAGFIGLAFIYWNKSGISRYLLLSVAFAGCSLAAAHGIYGIVYRSLQLGGALPLETGAFYGQEDAFVLWDLTLFEPWFLIEGILLGLVGWCSLKNARSKKRWLTACVCGVLFGLITGVMGVRFA